MRLGSEPEEVQRMRMAVAEIVDRLVRKELSPHEDVQACNSLWRAIDHLEIAAMLAVKGLYQAGVGNE